MKDRREYKKQWRAKKGRTYLNDYRRKYYQEHKEEVLLYQKAHNETSKERCQRWRVANPEKVEAGSLARSVPYFERCELCGEIHGLEKHHADYSEPLITVTLCRACHREVHVQLLRDLIKNGT